MHFQRIDLLIETATLLSKRPWAEVQLILRSLGVDTYETTQSRTDGYGYCLDQLEHCPNGSLEELNNYLTDRSGSASMSELSESLWGSGQARIFLSHLYENRTKVMAVKSHLSGWGVASFVAHVDISPSHSWRVGIKAALDSADAFVAFVDEDFHTSQWCDQEVGWALARRIPIIPVRPPGFVRQDAKDGFLEEHQDILQAPGDTDLRAVSWSLFTSLADNPSTTATIRRAALAGLSTATSFDAARRLWTICTRRELSLEEWRGVAASCKSNVQAERAIVAPNQELGELARSTVDRLTPPDDPPF